MQVKILKDIFLDSSNIDELNNILVFFRQERHKLFLDNYDDIEAFKKSLWAQELNKKDLRLINEYIKVSSRKEKDKLTITISLSNNKVNFTPKEAYLYLNQPLIVLVENSEYEPPFINAIIRNFDSSKELENAKREIWWEYGMAAGSSAEQVINGKIENSLINKSLNKSKEKYLRFFIIIDSDKKYPEMEIPEYKYKFMNQMNIPFHILYKREKENYMPDILIDSIINNDEFIESYHKLNPFQKDFLDYEKGFPNKNFNQLENEVIQFYSKIDEKHKKILRGKGIIFPQENQKNVNFKSRFSRLFDKADTENMLKRISHQPKYKDGRNEFEYIVNEIKKIL